MVLILAEGSPIYATMKKWATEFKQSRDNTEDDPKSSYQKASTIDEQVDAIHHMVFDEGNLTGQQIAKLIGISSGLVHTVLTETLGMKKLSVRWVPRILTPKHKLKRVNISRTLLPWF